MRHIFASLLLIFLAIGALDASAAKAKTKAKSSRADAATLYKQAQKAYHAYDFDEAADKLDEAEKELKRQKKSIPDEYDEMRRGILMGRNMLDRVEKIQIIDSLLVDRDDFFKYYKLSSEAGRLMPGSVLPVSVTRSYPSVVFEPQSNREVFWGEVGDEGFLELVSAQILDDGTFEHPQTLGEDLGEGGDADYIYFMPDGVTFYFANTGENSLGGYDIFLSRRDADGTVLQPQNVGMPYNSPYDDYMLVIDEAAHRGWWATDRNKIEDKVTIYVFVPNEVRQNYSPDDPNLVSYAQVASIAATQDGTVAAGGHLSDDDEDETPDFLLSLGNGMVLTHFSQLRNVKSETAVRQYLDRVNDYEMMEAQLRVLRERYRNGDKSTANDIRNLEKRVLAAEPMLIKLRNQAILAETKK
ncbi:MAG: hypothetical protein LIP09_07120 [Bacteroidales bacterium]|nr:hypothetical protein [Bacteroidales bacterium]